MLFLLNAIQINKKNVRKKGKNWNKYEDRTKYWVVNSEYEATLMKSIGAIQMSIANYIYY